MRQLGDCFIASISSAQASDLDLSVVQCFCGLLMGFTHQRLM